MCSEIDIGNQPDVTSFKENIDTESLRKGLGRYLSQLLNINIHGLENVSADTGGIIVCRCESLLDVCFPALFFPERPVYFQNKIYVREFVRKIYYDVGKLFGIPLSWKTGKIFIDAVSSLIDDNFLSLFIEWNILELIPASPGTTTGSRKTYLRFAFEQMKQHLYKKNFPVILISSDELNERFWFRKFPARLFLETGLPIFPVSVTGTGKIFDLSGILSGDMLTREVNFYIGKPIFNEEFLKSDTEISKRNKLNDTIKRRMKEAAGF